MSSVVSKRYAQALFELSLQENVCDKIKEDLDQISTLCTESSDFSTFIHNPILDQSTKKNVLESIFAKKVHRITLRFLVFLSFKARLDLLELIARDYQEIYFAQNDIIQVSLESSFAMSAHQLSALKQHLKLKFRKDIVLNEKVDDSLMGGFKVKIGDQVMDYSLIRQLENIKEKLIHSKD